MNSNNFQNQSSGEDSEYLQNEKTNSKKLMFVIIPIILLTLIGIYFAINFYVKQIYTEIKTSIQMPSTPVKQPTTEPTPAIKPIKNDITNTTTKSNLETFQSNLWGFEFQYPKKL